MQRRSLAIIPGLVLLILVGSVGGQAFSFDLEVVRSLGEWRQQELWITPALVWLTNLGGWTFLLPLTALACAWLLWSRQWRKAVWLLATVVGGRILVELMKWATDRPRPDLDAHPVLVASQAFPSGHAANSMITFLAVTLFALPNRWRTTGISFAFIFSLIVGATRPMLGVHWPTDVIGGWLLGALWVTACWTLSRRFRSA